MPATLYISRNPNPRLAATVARFLAAPVRLEPASPFAPDQAETFRALNPTRLLPILVEDGTEAAGPLWEADAIACRLSMMVGSDLWRTGADMPDMIRWISWGKANFEMACDTVHFELGTKQRWGMGPVDWAVVARGLQDFHRAARQLDAHLTGRAFLLGTLSYADFRMAAFLPYDDVTELPLAEYPALNDWAQRMAALPHWADPFAGLEIPALPPAPPRSSYSAGREGRISPNV